jgi:hypothetical protein
MSSRATKPVGIFLLVVVIAMALGLRISHPHDGLRNALGSAQSGLVIYRQIDSVSIGQTVMISVDKTDKSPVLANVIAVDGEKIQLQSSASTIASDTSHVMGKMIAVVPFLGKILSVVGL